MAAATLTHKARALLERSGAWIQASRGRALRVQLLAAVLAFQGTAFVLVANKLVLAHPAVFGGGLAMIAAGSPLMFMLR